MKTEKQMLDQEIEELEQELEDWSKPVEVKTGLENPAKMKKTARRKRRELKAMLKELKADRRKLA